MKKGFLSASILVSLLILCSCQNTTDSRTGYAETEQGVIIHIKNRLDFEIDNLQLEISQDGKVISSIGTAHADGSSFEKEEDLKFELREEELPLEGIAEIKAIVTDADKNASVKINNSVTIELAEGKQYFYDLKGDSAENASLE
ncbi:hypothetical protein FZC84_10655 [Rossellomorea vietnamensis]|uniref:Lipoprotein n=1 Tax=Rossellomorea vietnamensis TaxID=218284 RepID=A0A5D4MDW1_9BACI|nr:hypothetical protein [Rossellomorea vietnamensis]TYR99215.1 hypothetical protein FZC84_10655 [Rossellomorea vietnamensis]